MHAQSIEDTYMTAWSETLTASDQFASDPGVANFSKQIIEPKVAASFKSASDDEKTEPYRTEKLSLNLYASHINLENCEILLHFWFPTDFLSCTT